MTSQNLQLKTEEIVQNETTGFTKFDLPKSIFDTITKLGFTNPTEIQDLTISAAIEGNDILASSKTGSGKTLAFLLPLISKVIKNHQSVGMILAPTREIANQIYDVLKGILVKNQEVKLALLIGGNPMFPQIRQIRNNPKIVIGTPGRVNDHIDRGNLSVEKVDILVLDEMDRMLDMGFDVQIEAIIQQIKKESQKLMFSATIPQKIKKASEKYLNNPKFVNNVKEDHNLQMSKIKQQFISVNYGGKLEQLEKEVSSKEGSIIVFCKTKMEVEKVWESLSQSEFAANYIHGDLRQRNREKVIADFRNKKFQILVATDVAARGLDVPHIEWVINYDLPTNFDEYTHRIGRTNRESGLEGEVINFVSSNDRELEFHIKAKLRGENPKDVEIRRSSSRNGTRSFDSSGYNSRNSGFSGSSSRNSSRFTSRNSGATNFGSRNSSFNSENSQSNGDSWGNSENRGNYNSGNGYGKNSNSKTGYGAKNSSYGNSEFDSNRGNSSGSKYSKTTSLQYNSRNGARNNGSNIKFVSFSKPTNRAPKNS